jgi:hypothetical protein
MPLPPRQAARRVVLALFVWSGLTSEARGQDVTSSPVEVSGAVNVNTKGISLVPALTLGRPAAIFDLAVRKGDVSFEPQLRFALDGKPWSFLLWGRYRAVTTDKFRLTVGGHPAFSFKSTTTAEGGDLIEVRRYVAADVTPTWTLSPRVSTGAYYLYSHGIDRGAPPHTHFVAARAYLSNIQVFGDYVVHAAPQLYYLRTSGRDGTYVGASASVGRRGSPWSIGTIVNQPLGSAVVGGQRFLWNVSVSYAFK